MDQQACTQATAIHGTNKHLVPQINEESNKVYTEDDIIIIKHVTSICLQRLLNEVVTVQCYFLVSCLHGSK